MKGRSCLNTYWFGFHTQGPPGPPGPPGIPGVKVSAHAAVRPPEPLVPRAHIPSPLCRAPAAFLLASWPGCWELRERGLLLPNQAGAFSQAPAILRHGELHSHVGIHKSAPRDILKSRRLCGLHMACTHCYTLPTWLKRKSPRLKSVKVWSHHHPWAACPGASHLTSSSVSKLTTYQPIDYSSGLHLPVGPEDVKEREWPVPTTTLDTQGAPSWRSNCRDSTRNNVLVRGGRPATDPSQGPQNIVTPLAVCSCPG